MTPTYHLTTLGCAKNQVDSEKLIAVLAEAGYTPAEAADTADIVMVNTCAFIEDARRDRSSFIVGFPGENDADVEELADFLGDVRLDWAGFFPYSPEAGTPAADLDDRVGSEAVGERPRYLQGLHDDITAAANLDQVGRTVDVLVDQIEDRTPVGRSYRHAPEIDGLILLDAGVPGEWIRAEATAAYGTDMEAKQVAG